MNTTSTSNSTSNPFASSAGGDQSATFKIVGVTLAVASGLFIGCSFVFKKKGLIQCSVTPDSTSEDSTKASKASDNYTYLKCPMWWTGMILMIVGELCNFIAYAFTQAILVTPLGALSVVISAILSSIFLKERLSFQGKVGCLQCIIGAIVIVMHAPETSAADNSIDTFKGLVISPGFLVYASLAIVLSLFLQFYCVPRWGQTNMLVYIGICSLIGSISVVFTQGLGGAIVHSITISNQFTNWFTYLVLVIVIVTLIVEIVFLNKALNSFNTARVTPTYYVIFTTLTIVSSIVLFRGFQASAVDIVTCVFGFLTICSGVALLNHSKSEKKIKIICETKCIEKDPISTEKDHKEVDSESDEEDRDRLTEELASDNFVPRVMGNTFGLGSVYYNQSTRRNSRLSHRSGSPRFTGLPLTLSVANPHKRRSQDELSVFSKFVKQVNRKDLDNYQILEEEGYSNPHPRY